MPMIRTDLAAEAHALWRESAGKTTELPGVKARDGVLEGFPLTTVEILDREGAQALGKPQGVYHTLDISAHRQEPEGFVRAVQAVAALVGPLLPEGPVLAAGLGNPAMTPDALGPQVLRHLLITRHLGKALPDFRPVAAIGAGVLGTTGMEAAEWVRGAAEHVRPAAVILIDALAARELGRLCGTVQVANTGLAPGSGVGNHRLALDVDTLGVPVVSVGVPTVADCWTVARDILARAGREIPPAELPGGPGMFVTPEDIDQKTQDLARIIGYGLDLALQPGMEIDDLAELLA